MRKLRHLSTLWLFASFLTGCIKQSQPDITRQPTVVEFGSKPSGLQQVALTVVLKSTIDNTSMVQSKINSENGQPYTDGLENVQAIIDQNGNFVFSTNISKSNLAIRYVVYDLSDPVDPTNTYVPAFGRGYYNQYNYVFTTGNSQYGSAFIPLQNLSIDKSECLAMTCNVNGDGVNSIFKYTIRFHATKDDLSTSPTAFVIVTRIADNEWKIEPASCGTANDIGALWTGDTRNEIPKGYFHLPFSFKLTKR